MLTITTQQGRERYAVIPEELQNLIFAESTGELFEHIGEENHLDEAKTYELGRVAGLVLLGFLHRDDTRKELQEALAVNPMIANELQNELNKKLFAPIVPLLDKIYSPLSKGTLSAVKSIDSIIPSKPVSLENMPKPAPLPTVAPVVDIKPAIPKPSSVSSMTPSPLPNFASSATASKPATDTIVKKSPLSFTGSPVSAAETPAPVIPKPMTFVTQTGSQSAPVGNVPKFKMETPGTMTGSAFQGSAAPSFASAPRPAKIELGFTSPEKKPAVSPSTTFETQKSSVRYGVPTATTFSSAPAQQSKPAQPNFDAPTAPEIKKNESVPAVKKLEVTVSGLKIPPAPPKIEPPKPLL